VPPLFLVAVSLNALAAPTSEIVKLRSLILLPIAVLAALKA